MENVSTTELILRTTEGNRNAILTIPAKYDPNLLTVDSCVLFIQSQGVKISDEGNKRLNSAISQWKQQSPSEDVKVEVAQAVQPIHGKDATINWLHEALSDQIATATTEGNIDHYEQSAFKLINQGELLGEIIAATEGEDGIDVKGMSIAARPGKPLQTRIHESIEIRDENKLYAAFDGIFQFKDEVILINPVLDVGSQVDFSTGNIDFKGDVVIRHGVKDRFKVKATGGIKINGLVEDAIIEAGGDLDTYRGIVFRQSGSITVGGNLRTSHINNVKGVINGSLNLDREMINCQITIGDKLYSPNGSVIGGDNNISGSIKVSKLGSTAGVPIIRIGDLPLLTEKLKQFKEEQKVFGEKLKKIVGMMERLEQARILSPEQKELATDDKAVSSMLDSDPSIEVVGIGRNGREAVEMAQQLKPDLITLDIEMPEMDGLTALRHIMRNAPTHVVMLSSLTTEGSTAALRALSLGAADILAKDQSQFTLSINNIKEDLIARVKALGTKRKPIIPSSAGCTLSSPPNEIPKLSANMFDLICIGASTGGPPVLEALISSIPPGFNVPIVIAQHMPRLFTESMTKRLNGMCPLNVVHGADRMPLESGRVIIAPGGEHTHIEKKSFKRWAIRISEQPTTEVSRPSVDVLFSTAAKAIGRRTLAIILTGMGNDGYEGGKLLHDAGAPIIAQSEETCVVYGMPKKITENALAMASLSPQDIARTLQSLVKTGVSSIV